MNKKYLLLAAVILIGNAAFSQDIKKKIDVRIKDPATKKNAAKADVFIQNKQVISDTAAHYTIKTNPLNEKPTLIKKKTPGKRKPTSNM